MRWCVRLNQAASSRGTFGRFASEKGAEMVEAAIVLPVLLTLLIGTFWIGRAYNVYQTITRAAREGARFGAAPCPALGQTGCTGNTFPTSGEIRTVVQNSLQGASLDISNVTNGAPCVNGATGCDCPTGSVCIQTNTPLDPNDPPANRVPGVIVSFGYPFQLVIPFTKLGKNITITTKVQARQEF